MNVVDYPSLINAIKDWSNRADLSDEVLGSFVHFTGSLANQVLRVPAMEAVEIIEVGRDGHVIIPFDFLELRSLTHAWGSETSVPLSRVAWDQYVNYLNADIKDYPSHFFARQGARWFIAPKPAPGSKVTCHYYKSLPDISDIEPVNWLIQVSPLSYLFGALHFLHLYVFDEARAEFWLSKFQGEIIRIQEMNDSSEFSGASLAVRSKTFDGDL